MDPVSDLKKSQLIEYLSEFVSEKRLSKLHYILQQRTRYLTVVLEDIYQPHNASAVLRSCESLGIQDVHIVENENFFRVSKGVTIGADKWLTTRHYNENGDNNTGNCLSDLKKRGYCLVATSPHENNRSIYDLALTQKTALLFGTELEGLSDTALDMADQYVTIPMYGFSESFNLSVSAAICLSHLVEKMRTLDIQWQLEKEEETDLLLQWLRESVRNPHLLEKKFNKQFSDT